MRYAGRERSRCGNTANITDSPQLQPTHVATAVVEKQHFIRRRASHDLLAGGSGQVDSTDLVGRALEKHGILPRAIKEGAVVAMAELQNPLLRLAGRLFRLRHTNPCHPSPPAHLP